MPVNIGDYLKDTQHLDATRHGCYFLWLMHYWIKGPLPTNPEDLVRIGKLNGPDAWSIAHALLGEFFTIEADGLYHQKRSDAEKLKARGKSLAAKQKAADAAHARWKGHTASSNAPSKNGDASSIGQAMLEDMLGDAPSPSHKNSIETPSLVTSGDETPRIRLEEFGNVWNRNCGKVLPKIRDFTESRRRRVSLRVKQGLTLERFTEAVKLCTQKPFLRGEGNRGWTATFDWLMQNDTNITRVFEEDWGIGTGGSNGRPSTAQSKQAATLAASEQVRSELRGLGSRPTDGHRVSDAGGGHEGMPVPNRTGTDRH